MDMMIILRIPLFKIITFCVIMPQKRSKKPKANAKPQQKIKTKIQSDEIEQTELKKNESASQTTFSQSLPSLPQPPKTDDIYRPLFGSNYTYSNEIYQVTTPIAKQNPRFMPILQEPEIKHVIIFQAESEDCHNNSCQVQSSDQQNYSSNISQINSDCYQNYLSKSQEQGSRSSQNQGNPEKKEAKIRNRKIKLRISSHQSKQENPNKRISCNCKKTKCLKLYCDCFRLNLTCEGCNCVGCHNLQTYSQERNSAILALMDRNPDPFGQKIEDDKHLKGCNCKKSNCLKKYCECYQAELKCGQNCKCEQCKNMPVVDKKDSEQKGSALIKYTAKKMKVMVQI